MKRFFLVALLLKNLNFVIYWLWRLLPLLCALALGVSLYSFHPNDPGWSHSATQLQVKNLLRLPGAKVADLLFSTLGRSAWLLPLLFIRQALPLKRSSFPLWRTVGGGSLFLLMSAAFESIRLYSTRFPLPQAPGGVFGDFIGTLMMRLLGFNGATMLLLVLWAMAFSVAFGVSWAALAETLGLVPERLFNPDGVAVRRKKTKLPSESSEHNDEDDFVSAPVPAAPPRFNPQVPRGVASTPLPAASPMATAGAGRPLPSRYRPQVAVEAESAASFVSTPSSGATAAVSAPAPTRMDEVPQNPPHGQTVTPAVVPVASLPAENAPHQSSAVSLVESPFVDSGVITPPVHGSDEVPHRTIPAPPSRVVSVTPALEPSSDESATTKDIAPAPPVSVSPYAVLADSPASQRAPSVARRRSPAPIPLESVEFDEVGSPRLPAASTVAANVSAPPIVSSPVAMPSPTPSSTSVSMRPMPTPIIGSRPHPIPLFDVIEQAPVPEPVLRASPLFTVVSEPSAAVPLPPASSLSPPPLSPALPTAVLTPVAAAASVETLSSVTSVIAESSGEAPVVGTSVDAEAREAAVVDIPAAPLTESVIPPPSTMAQQLDLSAPSHSAAMTRLPTTMASDLVTVDELISSSAFNHIQSPLALTIGRSGEELVVADLVRLPHLLLVSDDAARITAALHGVLAGIFRKSTARDGHVLLLTPYSPVFQAYQGRELLEAAAPAADLPTVSAAIQNALIELERRYNHFKQYGVRNLQNLNRELLKNNLNPYPLAAIVLDDMGQMLAHADREFAVQLLKLAQYGPAGGMHFIAGIHPAALSTLDLRLQQALPARLLAIAYEAPQWQFQRTLTGAAQRLVMVELAAPAPL